MSGPTRVVLPDLIRRPEPGVSGWCAVGPHPSVSVPSLERARRCADVPPEQPAPCTPRLVSLDLTDGATLVEFSWFTGEPQLTIHAEISPGLPGGLGSAEPPPSLIVRSTDEEYEVELPGQLVGQCRNKLRYDWWPPRELEDGEYEFVLEGYENDSVWLHVATEDPPAAGDVADPCALTLVPGTRLAGTTVESPPAIWPRPPLLAVDAHGCELTAWAVHPRGYVLVPYGDNAVDLKPSCRGGLVARFDLGEPVRDAMFWRPPSLPDAEGLGVVVLLTASGAYVFELSGCALRAPGGPRTPMPSVFAAATDAVALGVTAEGSLLIIARAAPQVQVFRADGAELLAPASFPGRGWYATQRSAAFSFDSQGCGYSLDPAAVGEGCCTQPARALSDEESLFFRLVDDLSTLRSRVQYPAGGQLTLGPGAPEDALDARRPGVQWHRVVLYGEIPEGCAVRIETRAFDDLISGDPLQPDGWSNAVTAGPEARVPVNELGAQGEIREAAADALVLAPPGRYLWLRLTLESDGAHTPRITGIELEQPRAGISRFLPEVFQNSTPEDDFLRRWLSLFERTAFDGVAKRMDAYAELFDPRYAPVALLPFLTEWLQLIDFEHLRERPHELRRVLVHAAELAQTRGTVDGLILAVTLYLQYQVQIVESYKGRSGFVLGAGSTLGEITGPVLGCHTGLTREPSGVVLGDEPRLGYGLLLECETRTGTVPHEFVVRVPARYVCTSEALAALQLVLDTEKPAHTEYCIRPTGAAGWVLGLSSVLGQELSQDFDRNTLDPATYGLALGNGPPRPKPIGLGFALGRDSRLSAPGGQPQLQLGAGAVVGKTTRVGASI